MKERLKPVLNQPWFWLALITIASTQLLAVIPAVLTKQIIDAATQKNLGVIGQKCLAYLACALAITVSDFFAQYFQSAFRVHQEAGMKAALVAHLVKLLPRHFRGAEINHYRNVYNNEIPTISDDFYAPLLRLYQGGLGLAGSLLVLTVLDPVLMGLTLITAILPLILPFCFRRSLTYRKRMYLNQQSESLRAFNDLATGHAVIHNFGVGGLFRSRFNHANRSYEKTYLNFSRQNAFVNVLSGAAFYLSAVLILTVGAIRAAQAIITVGTIAAVLQLSENLVLPIQQIADALKQLLSTAPVLDEVAPILKPAVETTVVPLAGVTSELKLKELHYAVDGQLILDAVTATFEAGKHYLIVGDSGAGKSTLLNLIKGNLLPTAGAITLPKGTTVNQIVLIDQTRLLFDLPLSANISLLNPITETQSRRIAARVGMAGEMGKESEKLSEGQKQRIVFARSLYFNSSILLLDEVTSALDPENAARVERLIREYPGIVLHVTHHLETVKRANYDGILRLDSGKTTLTTS
ncbi:ATP-binding cassette domain-containing protein [Lacticaseibacillus suibinensis]|uniref:ATP-binding cassette domain-containing protein n=1 Tax=Lacticaseibacillus suibinensis TaxID=2486011 RepID=UPI0013DDD2A6|nr:ABC transporter ATP-binding protein [Lacticaseibacillus suibinensis]